MMFVLVIVQIRLASQGFPTIITDKSFVFSSNMIIKQGQGLEGFFTNITSREVRHPMMIAFMYYKVPSAVTRFFTVITFLLICRLYMTGHPVVLESILEVMNSVTKITDKLFLI